jgi:hypothetical protein
MPRREGYNTLGRGRLLRAAVRADAQMAAAQRRANRRAAAYLIRLTAGCASCLELRATLRLIRVLAC